MTEKDISVFVDESGSFDLDVGSSRYYVICLVLHDQASDISEAVERLGGALAAMGLDHDHCIHAGPLIRREREYANFLREDRRRILGRMMSFIRKADFSYACFALDKKFLSGDTALHDILLQQLVRFLVDNANDFNSYAHLKIYYDDGQPEVKSLLREAFAMYASRTEFVGEVHPENYRLFQAADTLCTLELMRLKLKSGERLSRSEFEFFNGIQNLNRNYFKPIDQKRHR